MPDKLKNYKYRINELLNKLSVDDYKKALHVMPAQLAISSATFNNYRNIQVDDIQDIPYEKVAIMEKLFNIECGQLANYTLTVSPMVASKAPARPDPTSRLGLNK